MLFTGEYEHTIDAKHRLAIPSEIRARLNPEIHGEAFYLVPGPNQHLWLWPERTFEQMSGALEKSLLPDEDVMEFEELIYPEAWRLEIDKTGRIRIPERVIRERGLGSTIVLIGVKDHLELRDPDEWTVQRKDKLARQAEIMLRARKALQQQHQPRSGEVEKE